MGEKFQVQMVLSLDITTGECRVQALYRNYKDASKYLKRLSRKKGAHWDAENKQVVKDNKVSFIAQRTVR